MRNGSQPAAFCPLSPLVIADIAVQGVRLRSRREVFAVHVLANDLFQITIGRGRSLSQSHSWAVTKQQWDPVSAQIQIKKGKVVVRTAAGQLMIVPADGSWELADSAGRPVFCALHQRTGFLGTQPRIGLRLGEGESLFGLGETTGPFDKRGLRRIFWNIDVLGHAPAIHPSLQSLYLSIPFALSFRAGRAAGLFWDNPARQTWDMGQAQLDQWTMQAASGEINLYLFVGPQVSHVLSRYSELTGRIPLPPLWGLGYHQCRYSYESRAKVEKIAQTFRRKKIPCDSLYLDIDHMDGYRVFTFGKRFPKPDQMLARLARRGFKLVAIVDPGVKEDPKFGVLKRGSAQKAFVKSPDGKKDYVGKVWPGRARFPDFTNARARAWWGREQAVLQKLGVAGFWNDMNEPANFAVPTKTLPENCLHRSDSGPLQHSRAHNVYGSEMARASREGALAYQPHQRPFIISRAGYAGVQRQALVWTGDNSSVWEHLRDSIQMLLNLGLSGVPFCGADVGGFLDNATGELLARWTQMAAFTPFFRNHSNIGTQPQEPWAYGPVVEVICKKHIELRYQLLPYLYLLFVEAHRSGTPIMRPLLWHYQNDLAAVGVSDQFLLGPGLLIAPIVQPATCARSVYLPAGDWFDFWTGEHHQGGQHVLANADLDRIPVYARGGSIIPMRAVQQYVGEQRLSTINLHLWSGEASDLQWYEDDGMSSGSAQEIHERTIQFTKTRRGFNLRFSQAQGRFRSQIQVWRVIFRGTPRPFSVELQGRELRGRFSAQFGLFTFECPNQAAPFEARLDYS